ncbi:MAG: 4-(cytidine 5'-diphospho)-2-C-methyl-D-erythritol kinase [Alphaproteobacteria bacterium]|nr:4-(cytidine 5'-diphospho)-2-C-methyl-D-erythritol kinase [Alphaproteobacteria bacterium]
MLETFAPAKINLYLHVTGQRADGYHYLDSLVAFTSIGDTLRLEPADSFSFHLEGPRASELDGFDPQDNLAVRAMRLLAGTLQKPLDFKLTLVKNLPTASGIGGGSTDAAAALRLMAMREKMPLDAPLLHELAATLGQDVPCCLSGQTCYFREIGNVTDEGPTLPLCHILMANPGQALSTPTVYKARKGPFDPPNRLDTVPETVADLAMALKERTNSLAAPAIELCPAIAEVLYALASTEKCLLARMSGSGATCFGLYPDRHAAKQAAAHLYEVHPDWWVAQAFFPSQPLSPSTAW